MNNANRLQQLSVDTALKRVIEPLASYICATDQPSVALMRAMAVLASTVNDTNRAANAYAGVLSEYTRS